MDIQQVKQRLDVEAAKRGLVSSRSQAESNIRLGKVQVNGKIVTKPGYLVSADDELNIADEQQYVGRAALKLKSADESFRLDFHDKTVLDVGSSTGGFTQYSLLHGASRVVAVDVGTDQLHPSLRTNPRIELYEKTDIRNVGLVGAKPSTYDSLNHGERVNIIGPIDLVVIDVSFISLREILPHVDRLITPNTIVIAMVKPQFEAGQSSIKHKGVIKNDHMRREVLKDFEMWVQKLFKIINKVDSDVAGSKGNVERFYMLRKLK